VLRLKVQPNVEYKFVSTPNFSVSYLSIITVTTRTFIISQDDKSTLFIEDSSLLDVTDKNFYLSLSVRALQSFEMSGNLFISR